MIISVILGLRVGDFSFIIFEEKLMPRSKMEQIKSLLDSSIAFIGVIAALIAVFSWYAGKKVDAEKAIEEERLKTRVAEANAESEVARKEAAKANESIVKTDLKAQELELEILTQKQKANILSLELETQKEKTANAETQLLQIKTQITPRSISTQQSVKLKNGLKGFTFKEITLVREIGDDESYFFVKNIETIFIDAGWNTVIGTSVFGTKQKGFEILYYNNLDVALKLQNCFREIGYNIPIRLGEKIIDVDKYLIIIVGIR